jgi:hypothetical protein
MFTKYSLQQTNNKWNSSPIDCPHKVQTLSSFGNSSRGQLYGSFKKDYGLENYLVRLKREN